MAIYSPRNFFGAVGMAGLYTGLLDITAAILSYYFRTHKDPERVFRFIASGIFGPKANGPGSGYVWLGALLHFFIAFLFSLFFFLLFPFISRFLQNWIVRGILYGLFVWAVMNLIVLPLSYTAAVPFHWNTVLMSAFYLVVAIGLPLSWMAENYFRKAARSGRLPEGPDQST